MVESAKATFEEPALDDLRCLIRLTVEFHGCLQNGQPEIQARLETLNLYKFSPQQIEEEELNYSICSIFSGIASFQNVNSGYKVLLGATNSGVAWGSVSKASLRNQFNSIFDEFILVNQFEKKCRLLLDLFKIQIVFAGVFFE